MECSLLPHPAAPPKAVERLDCAVSRAAGALELRYTIGAAPDALRVPPAAPRERTDGLWRTTCLELFLAGATGGYHEFNFAPSGQWAAYRFTGVRAGMAPLDLPVRPAIAWDSAALVLSVRLPWAELGAAMLGITAVIEERNGTKSYWALRHGKDRPDFHDPDCFVLQLPPAD
jgi:hypothetical protein